MLTRDELEHLIRHGEIDTVLMVFPDLQGRLVGKRTTGRFFLQSVAGAGTENCDYLIACDMDNNPVPGYRFTSYEQGYGDMLAKADWNTVRLIPWVEKTAMIMCDLLDVDSGNLVEVAPRSILQAQVDAAAAMGFLPMVASEIEFYLFKDTYDEAHEKGYRNLQPHSPWLEDYHILQTTKDEYILGAIRRNLEAAGVPVEFSKGEAGKGQHEINLDYTTAVEMADRNSVYKLAAKEIAHFNGRSVSFMAKYDFNDTGSSCHIHSSLWTLDGQTAVFDDHHGPHGMSETFQHYLAGQIATAREFSLLWAPTINSYKRFQLGSWAPTGVGWGIDNRTLGFRKVGHGKGTRRVSHSGQRCQQLLRLRGHARRRPLRHQAQAAARRGLHGQRLRRPRHPPHPLEHRRCHQPVGRQHDRPRSVRRGSAPSHPHHGEGRVGSLQPHRHRLGTAPLLGTHLASPQRCGARVSSGTRRARGDGR